MKDITDFIIKENWSAFTNEEHDLWCHLFQRQMSIFEGRVAQEHIDSLKKLQISHTHIPKFDDISKILHAHTGWEIVAVPGLVPDDIFFKMLLHRKFPSTCFLRRPDQIDYLQEPDIFHDIFGHIPLLVLPVFADYLVAFAEIALKCLARGELKRASRLYWFTIEFGLIQSPHGGPNSLRTYGAGIVSSFKETIYCVESKEPYRVPFSLERIMRTNYRIDDLQETYFVIDSYEQLFQATLQDHTALIDKVAGLPDIPVGVILPDEINIQANQV